MKQQTGILTFCSAEGILSTREDLIKFAIAQFDTKNRELALTRKPTFIVNDRMKIGLEVR